MAEPNDAESSPHRFKLASLLQCACEECKERRVPPPPVTDEMRAEWVAMGLTLTRKHEPTTRKQYRDKFQMVEGPQMGGR